MRWACALVLVGLAAGCRFTVRAVDITGGSDLASTGDMAQPVFNDMGVCLCPAGCATSPTPHCKALQPTGPVSASDYDQPGLLGVVVPGMTVTFNTDTGEISGPVTRPAGANVIGGIGFRVAAQAGGPSVGVFSVARFTLADGATMTFTGQNAFALASAGPVEIDGTVDAGCAAGNKPGPGGYAGGAMGTPNGAGMGGGTAGTGDGTLAGGGGGGGYGDIGGSGTGIGSNAGVIWGDLTPATFLLAGGAGGGAGGNNGGAGGAGGGAVQISANDEITVAGKITVGGCGGQGMVKKGGGGGGGAGGAIVLEGARVTLAAAAVLAANGGGGGGGDNGKTGTDGQPSVMAAPGGMGMGMGAAGGAGGASNGMPGQHRTQGGSTPLTAALKFGGGGGGGCGRIAVRAAPNGISDQSSGISPDVSDRNAMGGTETVYGEATFQ